MGTTVFGAEQAFVVNGWMAAAIAAAVVVLLLLLAHLLIVVYQPGGDGDAAKLRRRGVKALVIGSDGRASTSKVQAVLWTFAVFYAFMFLLVWGRSTNCDEPGLRNSARCSEAREAREAFTDLVKRPLQTEYYVVLGFPVTAALASKALTSSKVASGELTKTSVTGDAKGVLKGAAEVISNDHGETDLLDFQYLVFNLLTLAFFALEFATQPSSGLPELPTTLVALSGFSAATYTTKKALERDIHPAITAVVPRRIPRTVGAEFTVVGTGFGQVDPDGGCAQVLLEGGPLEHTVAGWHENRIIARLTPDALDALPDTPGTSFELSVMDADGFVSEPFDVEVYAPRPTTPAAARPAPAKRAAKKAR